MAFIKYLSCVEVILARVKDLPAWVFFPDFERVEWLNRALDQLWPSIGHFITHLLTTQVASAGLVTFFKLLL